MNPTFLGGNACDAQTLAKLAQLAGQKKVFRNSPESSIRKLQLRTDTDESKLQSIPQPKGAILGMNECGLKSVDNDADKLAEQLMELLRAGAHLSKNDKTRLQFAVKLASEPTRTRRLLKLKSGLKPKQTSSRRRRSDPAMSELCECHANKNLEMELTPGNNFKRFNKCGILWKKGSGQGLAMGRKSWQKRFFMLEFLQSECKWIPRLSYHSVEPKAEEFGVCRGVIKLENVEFRMLHESMQETGEKQLQFCLFHGDARCYELRAVNAAELDEWRVSLNAAILMVNAEAFDLNGAKAHILAYAAIDPASSSLMFVPALTNNPTRNKEGRVGSSRKHYPTQSVLTSPPGSPVPITRPSSLPTTTRRLARDNSSRVIAAASRDGPAGVIRRPVGSESTPTKTRRLGEKGPGVSGFSDPTGLTKAEGQLKGTELKQLFAAQRKISQLEKVKAGEQKKTARSAEDKAEQAPAEEAGLPHSRPGDDEYVEVSPGYVRRALVRRASFGE
jgi:hypothetical protein